MKKCIVFISILLGLAACGPGSVDSTKTLYIDTGVNPDTWVKIPEGSFLKGQHDHITPVEYDYEIMVTDVTNAQYAHYLNAARTQGSIQLVDNHIMGYYPGESFDGYNHEILIEEGDKIHLPLEEPGARIQFNGEAFSVIEGFENHPVVMVTWYGAKAYADFYGYRLTSEIEWEKAARGTDNRAYPWGNEIARNQANYYSSHDLFHKVFTKQTHTTPVGFYNGKIYDGYQTRNGPSPYGLYDMAGNVWQWTGDDYPYTHLRYMRGGSQANYEYNLRIWARNSAGPDYYGINIGFRCVRDVSGETVLRSDH